MDDLPLVGVKLVAENAADFLLDIESVLKKVNELKTSLGASAEFKITFRADISDADLQGVVTEVKRTAWEASQGAKVKFTATVDQASVNKAVQQAQAAATSVAGKTGAVGAAGGTVDTGAAAAAGAAGAADANAAAAARERESALANLARIEQQTERQRVAVMSDRERVDYEYNKQLQDRLTLQKQLQDTGAFDEEAQRRLGAAAAEQDALYSQKIRGIEEEQIGRQRQQIEKDVSSIRRKSDDAHVKSMSDADRLQKEYLDDMETLSKRRADTEQLVGFGIGPAQEDLDKIMREIEDRDRRYQGDTDALRRQQVDALKGSIQGFEEEIQRIGISRGQTFYVFEGLEQQQKEFYARLEQTKTKFDGVMDDSQRAQLTSIRDQYDKLYKEGEKQAEERIGERLRRDYYESSFMGELARAETRTYGARILAGEMQRYGAMMMGGGLAGMVLSQRTTERYLNEFRQPLGRVARALDLTDPLTDALDETLLDRAGKQSFIYASQQADAMRIWAEAINVVVDSYDDLISVSATGDTGLVPQTEMITTLVKLNEGSATLEQTVVDTAAIMTQFGLASSDAATQTNNLLNVVALLDTAASSGLADVNDIGSALTYFAGAANNLGISLTEAVVLVEALAQAGQKGSRAGRGLDMLFKSFSAPTPKTEKLFEDLFGTGWRGTFFDQQTGEFMGIIPVMQEFARVAQDMTEEQIASKFAGIGEANARRMFIYLLEKEVAVRKASIAAGKGEISYLETMVNLRNQGSAQIKENVAFVESVIGTELGDYSAIESYDRRVAQLAQQTETRYTNAMVRMDAAMTKLGKTVSTVVVPAFELMADIMGTVSDISESAPFLSQLFFGASTLGVLGGAAIAGAGTVVRGGIDIFALYSALQSVNGVGLPMRTRIMGLGNDQVNALIAAGRVKKELGGDEVKTIIRMASQRGGLGTIETAARMGPEALDAALLGAALAGTETTRSFKTLAMTVGKLGLAIGAAAGAVVLLDRYIKETVGKDEGLRRIAPEVADEAGFSQATWLLGPLATQKGKNWAQLFADTFLMREMNPAYWSGDSKKTQDELDKLLGKQREMVRRAESGELPGWQEFTGDFLRIFTGGMFDYFSVEGERRLLNRMERSAGLEPTDFDLPARRARVPLQVGQAVMATDAMGADMFSSAVDYLATNEDVLGDITADLTEQALSLATNMRMAGASAEDAEGFFWSSKDAIDALAARATDANFSMIDLYMGAEKLKEELQKAADISAEMAIRGGYPDITTWMGTTAPVDMAGLDSMTQDRLKIIGDAQRQMVAEGVFPVGEIDQIATRAKEQLLADAQSFANMIKAGFIPSESEIASAFDSATKGLSRQQELSSRRALIAGTTAEPDFDTVFADAVAMVGELETGLLAAGVEQSKVNELVQAYQGYLSSSVTTANAIPGTVGGITMGMQSVVGQMAIFVGLLQAAQGDASLLKSILENFPVFTGADIIAVDKQKAVSDILEGARRSTLTPEESIQEALDADLEAMRSLGATQEQLAQRSRLASLQIAGLGGSAKKAAMTFEDIVSDLRSRIAEKISPGAGLTVTDEEMAQTELGKYVDGAWEPLRQLASAATDPNTEWKHLLPEGIGVASPEAKSYFETVRAGVERFDPAFAAFFPDRRKIIEGVIGDLEGEQRQEAFITSVIQEMAGMGYDEAALRKYFENPSKELDKSVGFLTDGVSDLDLSVYDNTQATKGLTGKTEGLTTKTEENIAAMLALAEAVKSIPIPNPPPPPSPDGEGAPTDGNVPPDPYNNDGVPKMASGGLVTKPTVALIGEAGPELVVPVTRLNNRQGFVPPMAQINMRTMAPQIGQINMNTQVSSPSPAYVAHTVARSQRRSALSLGREILRAAAREGF